MKILKFNRESYFKCSSYVSHTIKILESIENFISELLANILGGFTRCSEKLYKKSSDRIEKGINPPSSGCFRFSNACCKFSHGRLMFCFFLTVQLMMFVDYGGPIFPIIAHAPWDGLHLADFVMPFFLFIAGVSLAIAYKVLLGAEVPLLF